MSILTDGLVVEELRVGLVAAVSTQPSHPRGAPMRW